MKKYFKVLWAILKNSYIRDSKISGVVFVNMINQLVYIVVSLIFFRIIFDFTDNLGGWTYYQSLALFGVARMMSEFNKFLYRAGVNSMANELVREGTLDFYLTKPLSAMLFVSISKPRLYNIVSFLFSTGVATYAVVQGHLAIHFANFLWFLFLLLLGSILYYFLTVIVIIPAFWLQRLWVLSSLIGKFTEIMRYPIGIFQSAVKVVVGLVFPIMVIAFIPVQTLLNPPQAQYIIYLIFITIGFGFLTNWFWNLGVKSYGSASS